jgi:hypothetical protein
MSLRKLTGGPADPDGRPRPKLTEVTRPTVEIIDELPTVVDIVDGAGAPVVTVAELDTPQAIVHVVEPYGVDPRTLVDPDEVPVNTPLVWHVDVNGVWRYGSIDDARWGQEIRFAADEQDPDEAPVGAVWVDWESGTIYEAEEA